MCKTNISGLYQFLFNTQYITVKCVLKIPGNQLQIMIGSNNKASNKAQAINWTNYDQIQWPKSALSSHDEL